MEERRYPLDTEWGGVWDLLRETGWSWPELAATPWPLVEEILIHILAERHWRSERIRQHG